MLRGFVPNRRHPDCDPSGSHVVHRRSDSLESGSRSQHEAPRPLLWVGHLIRLRGRGLNLPFRTRTAREATLLSKDQGRTVTVVIFTRNRPVFLRRCLTAISSLSPAPTEVLVVDNSEGDSDTRSVAQDYGVRYTHEPVRGLSRARNRGLAECETDVVAFLDDDASPAPEWLGLLLRQRADRRYRRPRYYAGLA